MTATYYFGDVLTGQILGDLPFSGVSLEWILTGGGTFSGDLKLTDPDVVAAGALTVEEGMACIYVEQGGALLYAGIVWVTDYSGESGVLRVTAMDYWSWFSRRYLAEDLTVTGTVTSYIEALLNAALDGGHPANLTFQWQVDTDSTVPEDNTGTWTVLASERKTIAELIEAQAATTYGFDFRMEVAWGASRSVPPSVVVMLGRPRLGREYLSGGPTFQFPGNVVSYSRQCTAADLAQRLYVRGAQDDETSEEVVVDSGAYAGRPRYERAESLENVAAGTLEARAAYLHARRARPVISYTIEARDQQPSIHSYKVGDRCRLSITDAFHPDGFEETLRIGAISTTPDDGKVTVTPWSDPDV